MISLWLYANNEIQIFYFRYKRLILLICQMKIQISDLWAWVFIYLLIMKFIDRHTNFIRIHYEKLFSNFFIFIFKLLGLLPVFFSSKILPTNQKIKTEIKPSCPLTSCFVHLDKVLATLVKIFYPTNTEKRDGLVMVWITSDVKISITF